MLEDVKKICKNSNIECFLHLQWKIFVDNNAEVFLVFGSGQWNTYCRILYWKM